MSEPINSESPSLIPPLLPTTAQSAQTPARGPWGFWATAGWGAIVALIYLASQSLVATVYVIADVVMHGGKSESSLEAVSKNGMVLGIAVILSAPLVAAFCMFLVRIRKGPTIRNYLGLSWPSWREIVGWMFGLFVMVVVSDCLTVMLGRPVVPDVMVELYRNTAFKPVIWIGIVLAAPLAEEFLFRGFLFRGWKESPLGAAGTVVLTAASWALIHLQYDLYGIATIFVSGILLGIARLKTGSVFLCMLMHALMNLIASIEVEVFSP